MSLAPMPTSQCAVREAHLHVEWNCVTRILPMLLLAAAAFAQTRPNGLYATFRTSAGDFTARLYEKETPNTVATFIALAQGVRATLSPTGELVKVRLYDNITFH